ncbi:MAG: hypothetical protein HQ570_04025 [Candidatus Omnitrophica bacterium]|nr:hypothetical protein [Candidatus Omnitrophota bacterium]
MRERKKEKGKMIKLAFLLILFSFCFFSSGFTASGDLIPVIKFKDADIRVVLQSIAQKATRDGEKVNIVISPNVEGLISINLEDVDWLSTLEAVLRPYDYSYEWIGETILLVDTTEKISERESLAKQREEIEPSRTRVFKLRFIDANDAKKAIEPILSPIGRISVLEVTGQAGWEFGTDVTKRSRSIEGKASRTKTLIISDISKKLDEIDSLLNKIDIMPKQVLIKARIMEIDRDFLKDIGFNWGTGITGGTASSTQLIGANKAAGVDISQVGVRVIPPAPSIFGPKQTSLDATDLQFVYRKLTGSTFEAVLSALEEDVNTKTLSSPNILTLDGQEASMLVGEKFPIVKTEVSTETSQITGGSLDYYQDIGIQLNVVPQISGENNEFISMIIHPAVTSSSETVKVTNEAGSTLVEYPRIISREVETQILIKDGETIAIGGLYKDVISEATIGIPILSKLPLIGYFFRRETKDIERIDLVIFITAKIVSPGELVPVDIVDPEAFLSKFEKR